MSNKKELENNLVYKLVVLSSLKKEYNWNEM
jgi:hypothetical protein